LKFKKMHFLGDNQYIHDFCPEFQDNLFFLHKS